MERSTQPLSPTPMYTTNLPGVLGPAPTYVVTAMHLPGPTTVYLATAPQVVGPSGMFDPMFELLDGGGENFGGVL